MKIDAITKFEIMAEAFRIMSGHLAPGKCGSPHIYSLPYEGRVDLYTQWIDKYGECTRAMILAFEQMIPGAEDDA